MAEVYGIVYKATNKINGKMYIGQTIRFLDKRIYMHIDSALNNRYNSYFHNAIRKYGKENFIWEVIKKCNSLEELNKTEVEMIKRYNSFGAGYNLTRGGEGITGFKHTEETKNRLSEAMRGEKHPLYGKHHSKESKKKMSESRRGGKNHMYGKHRSEETKRKIAKANRDRLIGDKHPNSRKYVIITPEGKEIFVHGLRKFCRDYKKERLNHSSLVSVAKGNLKQHKGYKCEYYKGGSNG